MSVNGYIAGTVPKPTGALTGAVSATGTVAATVAAPTGGLAGATGITGTIAATVKKPTANLIGGFPITGSIAATVAKPIGGCNPNNVEFRFKSRPLYYSDERSKIAEILYSIVFCEFNDDLNFDIIITTDNGRYSATIEYDEDERVVNNQAAAGRPYFRKFVQAVPPPGAFGSFFQLQIDKAIHHNNGYKFIGLDVYPIERDGIGPEFIAGDSTLDNGW